MSNVKDAVGLWREAGADLKVICKEKDLAVIDIAIITFYCFFLNCDTSEDIYIYTCPPVSSRCFCSSSIVFGVTT